MRYFYLSQVIPCQIKILSNSKKAYNDFSRIIRDLASSGEYYLPGDLGKYPDGTIIDGSSDEHYKYFCRAVANSLSTKSVDCETLYGDYDDGLDYYDYYSYVVNPAGDFSWKNVNMDYKCGKAENASAGYIKTADNIYIINHSPYTLFYNEVVDFLMHSEEHKKKYAYKYICIDIDEPQKGIKPFAIAFRRDGKMKLGARAKWWLERDITKKETDCCPLGNVEYTNTNLYTNLCDDGDTLCTE